LQARAEHGATSSGILQSQINSESEGLLKLSPLLRGVGLQLEGVNLSAHQRPQCGIYRLMAPNSGQTLKFFANNDARKMDAIVTFNNDSFARQALLDHGFNVLGGKHSD